MIYARPPLTSPIDQGDIVRDCPLIWIDAYDPARPQSVPVDVSHERVIVLTQTCDLAQRKVSRGVVAQAVDADAIVASGQLKSADIRGPVRSGRVFGWYFLPKSQELSLPEMIVDLRQLHTVRLELIEELCSTGRRDGRLRTPYRKHLAKHFADTYSRIGLPEPYATEQTA